MLYKHCSFEQAIKINHDIRPLIYFVDRRVDVNPLHFDSGAVRINRDTLCSVPPDGDGYWVPVEYLNPINYLDFFNTL